MKKKKILCLLLVCGICLLSGCRNKAGIGFSAGGKNYYFTAGIVNDTLLKSSNISISEGEALALYYVVRDNYENVLTKNIWNQSLGEETMEEYVAGNVRELLLRTLMVCELAGVSSVELSDDEIAGADERADEIFAELSSVMPETVTLEDMRKITEMLWLCDKVFFEYTKNINTEVSVDEARVIRLQYIYTKDSIKGIENAVAEIDEGFDFLSVAKKYSEADEYAITIGRNEMTKDFENVAFNLESGDVSRIVSGDTGYYLIKCVDDNVEGQYDRRVVEIIAERKKERFFSVLEEFSRDFYVEFDEKKWEESIN